MGSLTSLASAAAALLPLIVLLSIRVGVALATLPSPFGSGAPTVVRASLGFLIAFTLALASPERAHEILLDPFYLGLVALEEALIGAAIGLVGRGVVAAAEVAGEIAGSSMGLGFAHVVDPSSGEDSLVVARIAGLLAMVLFVALDGHHALLLGISRSVELAPVGHALEGLSREGVVSALSTIFGAGLRMASPVVGTLFFVQLALGLVARAAPRLQVFGLSFAVAAGVGLLALHATMPTAVLSIQSDLERVPEAIEHVLGAD